MFVHDQEIIRVRIHSYIQEYLYIPLFFPQETHSLHIPRYRDSRFFLEYMLRHILQIEHKVLISIYRAYVLILEHLIYHTKIYF